MDAAGTDPVSTVPTPSVTPGGRAGGAVAARRGMSPAALGPGGLAEVDVDVSQVLSLLARLDRTLTGPMLARGFLDNRVQPYFQEQIALRFAYEGDRASGDWPPLSEWTIRLKNELGYPEDTNIRTRDLFEFVTEHYVLRGGGDWASLDVPGEPSNPLTEKKLATAQEGSTGNIMGRGDTPPRPVIAVEEADMAGILVLLMEHIYDGVLGSPL